MSLDIDQIKNKLKKLKKNSGGNGNGGGGNVLWKPQEGKQTVRIVPYKRDPSNPFIEMYTHFNFGGDTFVSPLSFGDPDPLHEFAQKLKKQGDEDSYQQSKRFEPNMRTYVPVIVRGEESKGVRYWGFGKTVYQQLLTYMADEDYGDITHPKDGRDIVIEYSKPKNGFPKTNLIVKPNTSTAMDDMDEFKNIWEEQPDIKKIFTPMSYSELEEKLQAYLNSGESEEQETQTSSNESEDSDSDDAPWSKKKESSDDVESAFDELFD